MAVQNGVLVGVVLVPAAGSSGAVLRAGTAQAWSDLRELVHSVHGWYPEITGPGDGFRSLALQTVTFLARYQRAPCQYSPGKTDARRWSGAVWYRKPGTAAAAVPGTSNHGLGTTVDIAGLGGFDGQRYAQLAAAATPMGWSNTEGRSVDEAWHWTWTGDPDATSVAEVQSATPAQVEYALGFDTIWQEWDDMDKLIIALYGVYLGRTPSQAEVNGWLDVTARNGWSAQQLATTFTGSHAEAGTVTQAYLAFLGRVPESADVVRHWSDTETIAEVWAGVSSSAEAKARAGR